MRSIVAAVSLFALIAAAPAQAGEAEEKFVQSRGGEVVAALGAEGAGEEARARRAYDVLSRHVDIERVALFTLGRHVREMTDAQKAAYLKAFDAHVRDLYAASFAAVGAGEFSVTGSVDRAPGDSVVSTRIETDKEPLDVKWRIATDANGPKIIDVQYGGVWLAVQKRTDVAALFDQNGGDADKVIASLAKG